MDKQLKQKKEEPLWESRAMFERLFEHLPDAIVIVDSKGRIVRVNAAAETMFGYSRNELPGKPIEILIPGRFRERHVGYRTGFFTEPRTRPMGIGLNLYGVRRDGSEFPADIMLSPLETAEGVIVLGVVRDITERKRAEEELRRAHTELEMRVLERTAELAAANEALKNYAAALEEANRVKDLFTDIMHHDLLNPLVSIKLATELQLEEPVSERARKTLQIAKRNIDKLIEMIKIANMYAKLESTEELQKSNIDLNNVFREVVESFKPLLEEKHMKLEYLAAGECRALASPIIENVFSNLLSNAIKYSPSGGKIQVNIIDENKHYRIYVRDWGFGIKDEDKVKLFTRFQRVDKKGVKGTGLGLAIVKRIVELHGGWVWIEDNPEGGSVFYVRIPKA